MKAKECRSCHTRIPSNAKVCPYCYKPQWPAIVLTTLTVVLLLLTAGGVLFWRALGPQDELDKPGAVTDGQEATEPETWPMAGEQGETSSRPWPDKPESTRPGWAVEAGSPAPGTTEAEKPRLAATPTREKPASVATERDRQRGREERRAVMRDEETAPESKETGGTKPHEGESETTPQGVANTP